jgi:hypothetical protein
MPIRAAFTAVLALSGCTHDRFADALEIVHDIVVRNAKDVQSLLAQKSLALPVVSLSPLMTLTIKFDDKLGLCAIEVDNVGLDGMLPTKLQPANLTGMQRGPEDPLRASCVAPQLTGTNTRRVGGMLRGTLWHRLALERSTQIRS